jgi:hypothetical protein
MALVRLKPQHKAYLERTARRLSTRKNQRVSEQEVLDALLDLAIADEGIYDPADPGRPYDPLRRNIVQAETSTRLTGLGVDALVQTVLQNCSGTSKGDGAP